MKTDRILIPPKPLMEALRLVTGIVEGYKGLPILEVRIAAKEMETSLEDSEPSEPEYFSQIAMYELVDVNIEWDTE